MLLLHPAIVARYCTGLLISLWLFPLSLAHLQCMAAQAVSWLQRCRERVAGGAESFDEALKDCRAARLWWSFQRKPRILRGKRESGPRVFVGAKYVGTFAASSEDSVSKVIGEILSALRPAKELSPLLEFWSDGTRLPLGSTVGNAPEQWTILPRWGTADTCTIQVRTVKPSNPEPVVSFQC